MENAKMILPTLAFVFAIGAALAFEANTANDVYARLTTSGPCEILLGCTTIIGENICDVEVVDGAFYENSQCTGPIVTAYLREY